MSRYMTILCITLLVVLVAIEPTLAGNKFTKICGGVAGSSAEKLRILKGVGGVFGAFLILLGIVSILTRGRFEGLVGMVSGKRFEAVTVVPILLLILGTILVTYYFM